MHQTKLEHNVIYFRPICQQPLHMGEQVGTGKVPGAGRFPGLQLLTWLLYRSWPSEPGAYELTRHVGNGSSASVSFARRPFSNSIASS